MITQALIDHKTCAIYLEISIWGSSINYVSSEGEEEEHKNQQFLVVFKADLGLIGEGGCFECVKIVAMLFMDGP